MQMRWRIILPIVGLILFGGESYYSFRVNRETQHTPSRYFWWSAIRLDSDPANKRHRTTTTCEGGKENCVNWDLADRWVDPGLPDRLLMLSALPAFVVGGFAVTGLGRLGISQVSSFLFLMPLLILAWYYFIGWLVDRWTHKHLLQRVPTETPVKRRGRILSAIFILTAVLVGGFFYLRYPSRREREATLKLDLVTMRLAIDKYTLDKEQAPQSLQDLLNRHYLKEIPTDPFTRKRDWVPQFDSVVLSPEQSSTGMVDVHSASGRVGGNGMAYSEW